MRIKQYKMKEREIHNLISFVERSAKMDVVDYQKTFQAVKDKVKQTKEVSIESLIEVVAEHLQ